MSHETRHRPAAEGAARSQHRVVEGPCARPERAPSHLDWGAEEGLHGRRDARDAAIARLRALTRGSHADERGAHEAAAAAARLPAPPGPVVDDGRLTAGGRAFFAAATGTHPPDVRVHRNALATQAARTFGAHALTAGRDILVSETSAAPHTPTGRALLAHELAHAVQQAHIGRAALQLQSDGDDILPPDTVVAINAPPSAFPATDALGRYPAIALALSEADHARLRRALIARGLDRRIARHETPGGNATELERLRAERAALGQVASFESIDIPLRRLLSSEATPVAVSGLVHTLLPLLRGGNPSPIQVALVVRNHVLQTVVEQLYPEPSPVRVSIGDADGDVGLELRLAGTVITAPRGYVDVAALRQARRSEFDAIRNETMATVDRMARAVATLIEGRQLVARLPVDTVSIGANPAHYALEEVANLAATVREDASALRGYASEPALAPVAGEMCTVAADLTRLAAPLDLQVQRARDFYRRAGQEVSTSAETSAGLREQARQMRERGFIASLFSTSLDRQAARLDIANAAFSGTSRSLDELVLALRAGRISLESYRSLVQHEVGRLMVGFAVGTALGIATAWLGGIGGAAVFGANSFGASLTAGGLGGLGGGLATVGAEDIYSASVRALSSDPTVRARMQAQMHSGLDYALAGGIGMGTGMLFSGGGHAVGRWLTPRPVPGAPVRLFDAYDRPIQVQGGRGVEPPVAPVTLYGPDGRPIQVLGGSVVEPVAAPVSLFDASGQPIQVSGGQIVPPPTPQGPVSLLQGPLSAPRPLIVEAGAEWVNRRSQIGSRPAQFASSGFGPPLVRGESRLLDVRGESMTSLVRPPLPDVLTASGQIAPRSGPVIVDLQSGTGMWLRDAVANTPGSTGVGVEAGQWMATYRGIYPATEADLAVELALVRRNGLIPNDPAWSAPGATRPPLLPWEQDPMRFFYPQTGPIRVLPRSFFPAFAEGELLPLNPEAASRIRPTTHPELHGLADRIYLRRPFALARADQATTVELGRELNRMLRRGGFVEFRPAGRLDFAEGQIAPVAEQIEGASIQRVSRADIRAFQRSGTFPPDATEVQRDMIRSAAADTLGLGPGDFQFVVRIIKGG